MKLEERKQLTRIEEIETSFANQDAKSSQDIGRQEKTVRELEERFRYSQETRSLAPPMASAQPVSRSKRQFLLLGVSLGLVLSVLSTFVCEFSQWVRQRTSQSAT
jgi:hypothetical protein